tara:strand:+ start:652 stop:2652 length:2001 start_codon:yes stop_codon:yes gene_type:complete
MDPISRVVAAGAAGTTGAGGPLYVDDVFSTYTYEGTPASDPQTISNGLDLSGEGGMVWIKSRDVLSGTYVVADNVLTDTERGANKLIFSSFQGSGSNSVEQTGTYGVNSFNSSGFGLTGGDATNNADGYKYCSWSFRKAPGFFDVITYSGNGSNGHEISHNLGSTPGMILIKNRDNNNRWVVWHRSLGDDYIFLSENFGKNHFSNFVYLKDSSGNYAAPTSTTISLSSDTSVNSSSYDYVMYVFAHDDQSFGTNSDEAIINCGSYTGNGADPNGPTINLGFEPQWLLIKRTDSSSDWMIIDNIRFMNERNQVQLRANTKAAEERNTGKGIRPLSNGFKIQGIVSGDYNANNGNYIYMAIRASHKPPSAGTNVFAVDTQSNNSPGFTSNFPVDIVMRRSNFASSDNTDSHHRIVDGYADLTSNSSFSDAGGRDKLDQMDGWGRETSDNTNKLAFMFKRASTFMNQVVYAGNGSNRTVEHGLNAVPELYIVKKMTSSGNFEMFHSATGNGKRIILNDTSGALSTSIWQSTSPTSTVVSVSSNSSVNATGQDYLLTTFATVAGVSKVGTYSGTGNAIDVNCGFTAGARVVFIRRTDTEIQGAGGTYIYCFNTLKGIVSGNDPFFHINQTMTPVTNQDNIDPLDAGFTITAAAPAGLNASGGTYVFLAIA